MTNLLQEGLSSGSFFTAARIGLPKGTDLSSVVSSASSLKGKVGAILVPDNAAAKMTVSPLIAADRLSREGFEVILALSCRDVNRIGLGSMALGAATAGVHTILCVSGDHPAGGDHPAAKPVYDLDSTQLLSMLKGMADGRDIGGAPLEQAPSFYLGAAVSATANPMGPQLMKAQKKIQAGAAFLITLPIFSLAQIEPFLSKVDDLAKPILAGVLLPSYGEIGAYRAGSIPGVPIPDDLVNAWKGLDESSFRTASIESVRDLIAKLRDTGKFAGVLISASDREADIPELLV